ncbi:MAG: hypothetical protein AAFX45_01930 [Pseudomonadota bacterium]
MRGRQGGGISGGFGFSTTRTEAAEGILKIQMTRRAEREALARAGKTPIPGGEIAIDISALDRPAPLKRGWWGRLAGVFT